MQGPVVPGGAEREGPGPWLSRGPSGFSGWAHLTEVDPDEEVQGEIDLIPWRVRPHMVGICWGLSYPGRHSPHHSLLSPSL